MQTAFSWLMMAAPFLAAAPPAEDPRAIVREAVKATADRLKSGEGRGTFRRFDRDDKVVEQIAFSIVFQGKRFKLDLTYADPASGQPHPRRLVVVFDGTTEACKHHSIPPEPPGMIYVGHSAGTPYALKDLCWATSGLFPAKGLDKPEIRFERLPNGGYRARWGDGAGADALLETAPEAGHNIVLNAGFNKSPPKTGNANRAEWEKDGDVWYAARQYVDFWRDGVLASRTEVKYEEFRANPKVPPETFTLKALEIAPGDGLLTLQQGKVPEMHYVDKPLEADKGLETLADQVRAFPTLSTKAERSRWLGEAARPYVMIWCAGAGALAIFVVWYLQWRSARAKKPRDAPPL